MMRQAHRICSHSAKRLANDVVAEGSICGAARQPSRVSMTHPNFDSCRLQHARHVKPVPLRSWFQRTASTWHQINRPAVMSSMQGQVQQAGLEAAAEVLGKEVPRDSPAVDKVGLDQLDQTCGAWWPCIARLAYSTPLHVANCGL